MSNRPKFKKKNKVSKLNQTDVKLSDGTTFTIVHDMERIDGNINSFNAALQSWLARTDDYTPESFILYVKSKEPYRIFVTLEDYKRITKRKSEDATEDEYLAENN